MYIYYYYDSSFKIYKMLFRVAVNMCMCAVGVVMFMCNIVISTTTTLGVNKLHTVKRVSQHINNSSSMQNYIQHRLLQHDDNTLLIYGNSHILSYYYLDLYIGNSYHKQSYIIDTGSSITTSPCKPLCTNCGKHKNPYYELQSISSILPCNSTECSTVSSHCNERSQCSFSITYTEGSELRGIYINEVVHFTPNTSSSSSTTTNIAIPIGCTTKEKHLFASQLADGIIGLSNANESIISTLYNKGIISNNIFTICLSEHGGYFSLSEVDTKYHKSSFIMYIPLYNSNSPFYTVNIRKVTVGDRYSITLNENKNIAIIDSGSTLTYMPVVYYNNIITYINEFICVNNACGKPYTDAHLGLCYEYISDIDLYNVVTTQWPSITFTFDNNVHFIWNAENYFYNSSNVLSNGTSLYKACIGFVGMKEDRFILGANWMKGKDMVFDREQQRIGFVDAFCDRNATGDNDDEMERAGVEGEAPFDVDDEDVTDDDEYVKVDEDSDSSDDEYVNVKVNDDDDISDEEEVESSVRSVNGNVSVVGYVKVYCVVCVVLFGVVLLLGWVVFKIQHKVRKNMLRLEQEVENEPELVKLGMDVVSPTVKHKMQSKIVLTNQSESSDNKK